jgi:serine/threonine protein kinase
MRWCGRCRRRFYEAHASYCPYDGGRLESPEDPDPTEGDDPVVGTTLLGQFHLVAPIGSGAMGTVYRAWQSGMERQVAVKLLRADLTHDQELRRRFLREARAAARLAHPNIVCVHLVGETEAGVPYLVMEHLAGETLDDVLERDGQLAPRRAVAIARQIACALAEAHAEGVVHRDLKPANVILTQRRASGEQVKIVDFGIAKVAHGALLTGCSTRLTREGVVFGTPHYIAPEQAQGAAIDGRADLYSLGVLLYRMLSGTLPFDGGAIAVLLAHISRQPPHLLEVAPGIDRRLAAIVMRCMAKNPAERFADAEGLAAALAALEAEDAEVSAPAPRPRSQPRPASRPPALVVPTIEAEKIVLSLPVDPPPPRRMRAGRIALAALALALLSTGAGTGAAALRRASAVEPTPVMVPHPEPLSVTPVPPPPAEQTPPPADTSGKPKARKAPRAGSRRARPARDRGSVTASRRQDI